MLRSGTTGALALAAILTACGSSDATTDDLAPACNGASSVGLTTEQTAAGQCPTSPATLTGAGTVGTPCSDPTDCAPLCCTCAGTGGSAAVAQCTHGNCLDGATTCCLYAQKCGS